MSNPLKSRIAPPDWVILKRDFLQLGFWHYLDRHAEFWFLYHFFDSGAELHFGDRTYRPEAGMLFLIPPRTIFSTAGLPGIRHFYYHFTVAGKYAHIRRREIVLAVDPADIPPADADAVASYTFLGKMLLKIPPECFDFEHHEDERMFVALKLLGSCLSEKISNFDIARRVGMSESNFLRLFLAHFGRSPQRYRLGCRLEEAMKLLYDPDFAVEEIAARTGFADRYHFSKSFKQYYGYAQGAFRRTFPADRNE